MLGISNTLVGNVNDAEEPAAKARGCWDCDTLANLGFTNIRFGGTGRDSNHENQDQGVLFAEAEWKVQRVRGTNPLKVKKKIKNNSKSSDANHLCTIKMDGKPASIKSCMKNMTYLVALANAISRSAKTAFKKSEDNRYTLDRWKLYLDSCATYHYFFAKEFLWNIEEGDTTLTGSCNAGTTVTNTRGWWGEFQAWLNKQGIANLLSIPMLEAAGYVVSSHTKKDWVVFTPKGKKIVFKRDTGVTKGMLYIDLRTNKAGLAMINTVRKNVESYAKKGN